MWAFSPEDVPNWEKVQKPASVHVWGGISVRGTTRLVAIKGSMNAAQYTKILRAAYFPVKRCLFPRQACWLVQDNATLHKSRQLQQLLTDKTARFILPSDWPAKSPDLNPMVLACAAAVCYTHFLSRRTSSPAFQAMAVVDASAAPPLCEPSSCFAPPSAPNPWRTCCDWLTPVNARVFL